MIKIRKNNDMMTTWAELKDDIRDGSSLLNVGDEIDIELKTGEKVTLVCERVGHRSAVEHDGGISWQTVSFVARRIAWSYNRTTSVVARERGFWRKRIRKGRNV